MPNTQEKPVKKALRATLLTLITAGILSAAVTPKDVKPVSPKASPIPMCPYEECRPW
jgi:hypothetical protein